MFFEAVTVITSLFSMLFPATAQTYRNVLPPSHACSVYFEEGVRSENFVQGKEVIIKEKQSLSVEVKKRQAIVIFVHGTLLPVPSVKEMRKNIAKILAPREETLNQVYSTLVRDSTFLGYQPIAQLGLHPVDRTCSKASNGAQLLAWWMQEMYLLLPPAERAEVEAYTFGWDGVLNDDRRKIQAKDLLASIRLLIDEKTKKGLVQGKDYEIIGVTHSHGGNVALNMPDWLQPGEKTSLDYLINLGTPIHEKIEKNIESPLFKNVWNIHSKKDWIQVADFISIEGAYKRKRVYESKNSKNLKKLKQVLVEFDGRGPYHSEMWFFYRSWVKKLFKSPLPTAAFIPLMLHLGKKTKDTDHYLKMSLSCKDPSLYLACTPFVNYGTEELSQAERYECSFNFSNLLAYLFAVQRE